MSFKRKYHVREIHKGVLGHFTKVWEEYQELKDAHEQKLNLMCLCELSDLYGALMSLYCIDTNKFYTPIYKNDKCTVDENLDKLYNVLNLIELDISSSLDLDTNKLSEVMGLIDVLSIQYSESFDLIDIMRFSDKTKEACNNENI